MTTAERRDEAAESSASLRPVLGQFSALAVVVGGVIGSGIFLKPSQVAEKAHGYVALILALWIVLGLINLCGALAVAELSAMFPRAGGSYVYLREAYSPLWAFAWAWAEFFVIRSGSIAALAAAMAIFVGRTATLAGWGEWSSLTKLGIAVGSIFGLAAVNIVGTRWGGAVQNVTTIIKGAFVAFLALLPFVAIEKDPVTIEEWWPHEISGSLLIGIGSAVSGIMWAYDGWIHLSVMAEEVRHPERYVPRALIIGLIVLIVLYTGANVAYFLALPVSEIAAAKDTPTAELAAERLLPHFGGKLTLAMMAVSVFGALNACILSGPRVTFAAARDNRFLGPLRHIDPRFGTPAIAIGALSAWSALLMIAGEFLRRGEKPLYDVVTDYCIFGAALFYLATVVAVFVLRRRQPDTPRPYRAWGYPLLPGVFVVSYVAVLAGMFAGAPYECETGLLLIALGIGVYLCAKKWEAKRRPTDGASSAASESA